MTAPAIVLVPGPGGASEDFGFLAPMLSRHHDVVVAELGSASDADELLDAVGRAVASAPGLPAVVGYAIGGVAAVGYAAEHPEDVSALVAIASWWLPSPKLAAHVRLWRSLPDREQRAEAMRLARYSAAGWDSARQPSVTEAGLRLMELSARIGTVDSAPRVTVPSLVIGCRDDELVGARESRLLFGAIPDARYAELASGHAVLDERPAEVLQLIEAFLGRPERHPAGTLISAEAL